MNEDRSGLASLVGDRLGAITFVHDYVQLSFDGAGLPALISRRVIVEIPVDDASHLSAEAAIFRLRDGRKVVW